MLWRGEESSFQLLSLRVERVNQKEGSTCEEKDANLMSVILCGDALSVDLR